jgi:ABC-type transport system substrate-binding protein
MMMKKTLSALLLSSLACGAAMAAGTSASSPTALQASSAVVHDAAQGTQVVPSTVDQQLARRKPRVPGGSGCDDPRDLVEHPECRPQA